ncbi:hypothetical protein ANCCAN_05091 [Ancylostoma caninum]|uniref:Uncharacterized protein n=1 Tax=Ancylostoma caninum TaxID=29170 RepID=A0A368GZ32_ANCCA|nr:hypothetical protein ANCCAN_05091 [Ancylostoma caninum]
MQYLLLPCLLPLLIRTADGIRCYSGLKYVVGQDEYQDSEECNVIFGMGDSYCYTFREHTSVNEIVKMGCSNLVCNADESMDIYVDPKNFEWTYLLISVIIGIIGK